MKAMTNLVGRYFRTPPRHLCRRAILIGTFLLACPFGATATAQDAADKATSRLRAQLDAILVVPPPAKAELSAHVVDLGSGDVLYNRNGSSPKIPASNMKLVVMAAAVDELGPDYTFQTALAIRDLDLVVIGSGDPTLGDERLAAARGEDITAVLRGWAKALKEAGVEQVPGNIVIDDLIFDLKFTHPRWPKDQYQSWYEAPIGGLNFNNNCVQAVVAPTNPGKPAAITLLPDNDLIQIRNKTTTGKKKTTVVVMRARDSDKLILSGKVAKAGKLQEVTVRDPGLFFGAVLKKVLAAEGIPVGGRVVREKVRLESSRIPDDCYVAVVHRTPLADVLGRCGKDSLGMMAEGLFKTLGYHRDGLGTWNSGRSALHAFLRRLDVAAEQVTIDDGSGLSRTNRLSAAATTRVLRHMYARPAEAFDAFRGSLAVGGVDGTLKKRMRSTATKGRIFAKTGTINGVRTLAGYVHTHSDRWLAFALYYNAYSGKRASPKSRMDRACRRLVYWPKDIPTSKPTRRGKTTR